MPIFGGFGAASGQRTGLSSLVSQRLNTSRSDRTRRDHANATLPKKAPRSKAAHKPSLTDGYQEPKLDDCLDIAALANGESTKVINLSLQGRLPFPSKNDQIVRYIFTHLQSHTDQSPPTELWLAK